MSDNSSDSSDRKPQKTVDESSLNTPQAKKTVVEPTGSQPPRAAFVRKDSLEGKTIGDNNRYLLQTLLGQGGMSKVYRALDTKFEDKVVAIKLMTIYSAANAKHLINRFMAEIQAISCLKHPNIIQIFDYGVTPEELPFYGTPFYVMEYFTGKTLQDKLTAKKTLPLDYLLNIIHQVCVGLKEAHQKGIIHRDLKPDNIFLIAGGAFGEIVKIIDFGIAKNISSDNQNYYTKTQTGTFIGTYHYASPEQCRGLANIDQRSDIYSLGIILYEAICGTNPYDLDDDLSTTERDWIACHIRVPPKPIKEQPGCENIDDKLAKIVMKCLIKSPQDRFADIGELQDAFDNAFSVQNRLKYKESITSNNLDESYSKTIEETKQKPIPTVVESEPNPTPPVPSPTIVETKQNPIPSVPSPSVVESSKRVGLIAGLAAILMAVIGVGGYLLINHYQPSINLKEYLERISQTPPDSTEITPDKNITNNIQEPIDKIDLTPVLERLETQYQQEQYQDCYQLAINNLDHDNSVIKEWISKCGLAAAKIKAEANSYSSAIAIAQNIPNTVSNYQEVKDSINTWSGKILDYATKVYQQQGKLEEAIKITNIIPEKAKVKTTIPDVIAQWLQEEKQHQAIINDAQNLLNRSQWKAAKQEIAKIPPDFGFWRQKAQAILDEANQPIIKSLEDQYQQEKYQDCYQLAINNLDRDNSVIKEWISKCGLAAAKIKAEANSYSSAIAIAQNIPNTVSNYQEVKDSINIWSGKILDYATKVYQQQGKLESAIKITDIIPENTKIKTTIPDLISQWQQDEDKYQAIISQAQQALNEKAWFVAKQKIAKIPADFGFWRQKAQPILDEANRQINAIAAAEKQRQAEEKRLREQAAAERHRLEAERNRSYLISKATGIDYSRLQNLLAARKWEKAGVEETRVMLQAANREKEGWLRPGVDIENISCEDLRIMDSMTEWYEWDNDNDKVDNEKEKDWAQGAINGFNWQMIARVLGVEEKFNRRFELSGREGIELFRVFFGYLHEMSNEWKKREKDCGI